MCFFILSCIEGFGFSGYIDMSGEPPTPPTEEYHLPMNGIGILDVDYGIFYLQFHPRFNIRFFYDSATVMAGGFQLQIIIQFLLQFLLQFYLPVLLLFRVTSS